MAILNYTTTISEHATCADIQKLLSSKGARQIMLDYDVKQRLVGISFTILSNDMSILFRLPANFKGVQKALIKQTNAKKYHTEEHAMRVCWRIIKDWISAQMAIVEADQADMATVFLPYSVMQNGATVSENFLFKNEGKQFLLDTTKSALCKHRNN